MSTVVASVVDHDAEWSNTGDSNGPLSMGNPGSPNITNDYIILQVSFEVKVLLNVVFGIEDYHSMTRGYRSCWSGAGQQASSPDTWGGSGSTRAAFPDSCSGAWVARTNSGRSDGRACRYGGLSLYRVPVRFLAVRCAHTS